MAFLHRKEVTADNLVPLRHFKVTGELFFLSCQYQSSRRTLPPQKDLKIALRKVNLFLNLSDTKDKCLEAEICSSLHTAFEEAEKTMFGFLQIIVIERRLC